MAKVVGVAPPMPPRRAWVRTNVALRRWSSGDHGPGEIEGGPGHVRVDIDAAGKDDHPRGVDGPAAVDISTGNDAAIGDANVLDFAIDAVRGVVNFAALDAQDRVAVQRRFLSV